MISKNWTRQGEKATKDLFHEDRAQRNSPVDCFSEGPASRGGMMTTVLGAYGHYGDKKKFPTKMNYKERLKLPFALCLNNIHIGKT
jgi:hypothetical protein